MPGFIESHADGFARPGHGAEPLCSRDLRIEGCSLKLGDREQPVGPRVPNFTLSAAPAGGRGRRGGEVVLCDGRKLLGLGFERRASLEGHHDPDLIFRHPALCRAQCPIREGVKDCRNIHGGDAWKREAAAIQREGSRGGDLLPHHVSQQAVVEEVIVGLGVAQHGHLRGLRWPHFNEIGRSPVREN